MVVSMHGSEQAKFRKCGALLAPISNQFSATGIACREHSCSVREWPSRVAFQTHLQYLSHVNRGSGATHTCRDRIMDG